MSTVQPQGEALKKAIEWVSEQRRKSPDISVTRLANDASLQFDLSPKDSEFLLRFVKQET
ncbi:MAG: hypothetical protein K9K63_02770 [Desulfotignum sp.]|nr:hypothetical protein [Desulfotignum sp.]MCF8086605.1 hypothetical protein [Desulfotignum sp.]MCF8136211.1 hypothetical protein [Desulfotignum sp.]